MGNGLTSARMTKFIPEVPRFVLGFVLFAFGLAGLLHLLPQQPPMEGAAGVYMAGLTGSYLFTLVKATEVVVGALLLSNRLVPLALTIAAPVLINIAAFHAFYAPAGLGMAAVLIAAAAYTAWRHRAVFAPMFAVASRRDLGRGALDVASGAAR